MPFPESKRVVYRKNPLSNVICQLRYPPILKIDSEVPSFFQENIRTEYPLYNEKIELQQEFATGLKSQFSPDVINQLSKTSPTKNHEFISEDGVWKINLTRTFLSISTSKYIRWEDFIKKFHSSYKALISIYNPAFFSRVGIRYVDVFERSKVGLQVEPWNNLIQPYLLGLLASDVKNEIKSNESLNEILLNDSESIVRIATSFVQNAQTSELCYMVDSDFYTPKRVSLDNATSKLEFLHDRASRLIRWIITDKLHNALEPREI